MRMRGVEGTTSGRGRPDGLLMASIRLSRLPPQLLHFVALKVPPLDSVQPQTPPTFFPGRNPTT
ncbi:hypothetical protein BD626DRAFT_513557 [Schizophyllum amplum]|uniref:Uncharacterized protein n=1 Tax=Schizophyllum amplum TaxID=97359 RepID=A0A550BZ18_9AGAR|nr:hypothetical protein BD626DRAFT_513557 [Auriculariopsis ampla]